MGLHHERPTPATCATGFFFLVQSQNNQPTKPGVAVLVRQAFKDRKYDITNLNKEGGKEIKLRTG